MTKFSFKVLGQELAKRKEGLIIGGLVGLGFAYYTINYQNFDLQLVVDSGKGLLDDLLGRSSNPAGMAANKVYLAFVVLGAAVGYYVELLMQKAGYGKKRRKR